MIRLLVVYQQNICTQHDTVHSFQTFEWFASYRQSLLPTSLTKSVIFKDLLHGIQRKT